MENRHNSRLLLLISLFACALAMAACSYTTNFVVVNVSDKPIEVRYKIKKSSDPNQTHQILSVRPGLKPISELHNQVAWRDLSDSEFSLDPPSRMVVVSLMPGNALRIEHRNREDGETDEAYKAENFSIEEIDIVGANGEIHLKGEEVRKSFVPESKSVCTVRYK